MNERIVVEHATKVQVANLAQSRTLKVTKPQGDQSIVLDLSDRNATFDLSAVADEKMTLVKVGPKLVILFDNQSTVTADPFFDFSGKPLANLDVELGTGRAISGEQFAQLFSITEDQSVLHAAGIIPPSGADFHDASVDVLAGMRPLALLEQEGLAARASDADDGPFRHNIAAVSPNPTVTVPSPGGLTTTVFEAGLLASRGSGESAGTHPGQSSFPTTTKAGAISFSSPADVFTYTIQDADGTLAHTTLTITLGDAAPTGIVIPAPGGADTQVFEAGLLASRGPGESAGSHAGESGFPVTTQTGTIRFTSILADAGICQNGLRNRIIDRKPLSPNFSPHRGHERENRSNSKKLHSAASNKSWFPHIVGKAEKNALNIIKYIVEMVNKWLTRRCASRAGIGGGRKRANPAPRTTSRLMHQGAPKFVSRSTDLGGKFAGLVELELAFRCPGRGQSAVDEKAHSLSVVMAGIAVRRTACFRTPMSRQSHSRVCGAYGLISNSRANSVYECF